MKFSRRNVLRAGGAALSLGMFAGVMNASDALAQARIDITRGRVEPMPIAVPVFPGNSDDMKQMGRDVADVISKDLERSGLFRPLDQKAFLQEMSSLDVQPRFADWRTLAAQALVQGAVEMQANGQIRIAFRLWDVFGGQQMEGKGYGTDAA